MPLKTGMPRDVDERKKRKALRKIRKAAMLAEQGLGPPLSDWEKQFLEEVEERIEKFGSAFHDLEKGGADEALSSLQFVKLREIDKKARGKGKSGFKSKGMRMARLNRTRPSHQSPSWCVRVTCRVNKHLRTNLRQNQALDRSSA